MLLTKNHLRQHLGQLGKIFSVIPGPLQSLEELGHFHCLRLLGHIKKKLRNSKASLYAYSEEFEIT